MTTYYQLSCPVTVADDIETITQLLDFAGANAITYADSQDQPILEPLPDTMPLWQQTTVIALFTDQAACDNAADIINHNYPDLPCTMIPLAHQDWLKKCQDQFQPICFGEKLWIYPSWQQPPADAEITVQLDPGLAFGTGSHPTTALCLEWLATHDLRNKTIVDYGCGSGILAIAALKLGAKVVFATDIDPQALQATADNANRNNVDTQHLLIRKPNEMPTTAVADIVIANIVLNPLLELRDTLLKLLGQDGKIVLSGLLKQQQTQIIAAYKQPFIETYENNGWILNAFYKDQSHT